jgi:uncharacterized protein (TIRG00374 family)
MRRRWIAASLAVGAGAALIGGLIYISGPRLVFQEIRDVGVWGLLAVVGTVFSSLASWLASWAILLRGADIRVSPISLARALVAGYAVSYVTPSMYLGGEPVRAYLVSKDAGVVMPRVMATVIVERMLGTLALLIFASIGGFFALVSPQLSLTDKRAVVIAIGVVALLLFTGILSFARDYQWFSRTVRFAARLLPGQRRVLEFAARVATMEAEAHRAFAGRFGYTLVAFLFQILTIFINYLRPQVFFYFTQRTIFTVPQLSLYFTLNAFLTAFFWITPGGLGIAEGGRMGIFTLIGVRPSGAIAYSVLYRFAELLFVGLGGYFLIRRGLVGRRERSEEDPSG